ncbi:hypothetical protein ACA910_013021 [Epithemia clementina (nom. ined.)]
MMSRRLRQIPCLCLLWIMQLDPVWGFHTVTFSQRAVAATSVAARCTKCLASATPGTAASSTSPPSSTSTDGSTVEPRLNWLLSLIEPSQTVEIFSRVKDMRANGVEVTGGLCVGEPDFGPPPEVLEATIQAVLGGETRYTAVSGTLPLRQAIAQDLAARKGVQYDPATEIVVANGAKQAVYQGILAMAGVGDSVLIPAPYWPSYPEMVKLAGAKPIILETTAESGYLLSPSQLRSALESSTSSTAKLLILCNPSNPTGGVYSKEALLGLSQVLQDFPNVFVLADEIYDQLVYSNGDEVATAAMMCPSFAAMPGMWERTLTINGFSKSYAMTGYRLGYLAAPKQLARACTTLQSQFTSCASSLAQAAGVAALTQVPESWILSKVSELKQKRDHCLQRLANMPKVIVHVPPQGAFYVLPDISAYTLDDVQFCQDLLQEQKLALVPGSSFGAPGTVRMSYATSLEELDLAMDKLAAFLASR